MDKEFVCVPVSFNQAQRLASGHDEHDLQVFRVEDQLRDAFGLAHCEDEEADRAAMLLASLWALTRYGRRIVLTAMVDPELRGDGEETHNGGAYLETLKRPNVEALFTDEPQANDQVRLIASRGLGHSALDEIWELAEVQHLLINHELLWYTLDELPTLGWSQDSLPAK